MTKEGKEIKALVYGEGLNGPGHDLNISFSVPK